MTFQKSLKYSIIGFKRWVIVLYIIIVLLLLFGMIASILPTDDNFHATMGGMEMSTVIFLFVLGFKFIQG